MEIVRLNLENEMDLILAHKRCMKLAELCGLSVIVQTSFATAVSEISRCVIKDRIEDSPQLKLEINVPKTNKKELLAAITANRDFEKDYAESLTYARRLADNVTIIRHKNLVEILFTQKINFSGLINESKLQSFADYFKNEPPLSPYDELRKKNIQLLEVSEKLRDSERQYKALTETLPLMMFATNSSGYITYANKWFMDFFKLTEIRPGKLQWISFLSAGENKTLRSEWDKALLSHSNLRTQGKLQSKPDNDPLWHLISLIPIKNDQNQLVSWTGFFVDIHAQKRIEETLKNNEELKLAQKQLLVYQSKLEAKVSELNKSNYDLEQFAYIASHDLQEPLRKIRNFSDLLEKNLHDKEKANRYINKIDDSSSRMLTLIKDVLNYSRLSKVENDFVSTYLHNILNGVILDMELLIQEKKAVINTSNMPVINGIPQQLYQLFYNLVSNALKFSKESPVITITSSGLSFEEIKKHPDLHVSVKYIKLVFKDNGIGFDDKYASQIFTIFKRLHPKGEYGGTGIGLALCKKIVENHFGQISVTSEPGKGTSFEVILPVE